MSLSAKQRERLQDVAGQLREIVGGCMHDDGRPMTFAELEEECIEAGDLLTATVLQQRVAHPREVFKLAILEGSSSIIVSHNHPSGDATPSREDHTVTERLTEAGKLLGIEVLDHIIHGDGSNDVLSLKEAKL